MDTQVKVNFKIYNIIDWTTKNSNTHIAQYLKNEVNHTMKFDQLIEYNMRHIFLQKL